MRFRRGRITPAIAKTQLAFGRWKCGATIDGAITINNDKLGTSGFFSRHAGLISNRSNQRLHAKSAMPAVVHCKIIVLTRAKIPNDYLSQLLIRWNSARRRVRR